MKNIFMILSMLFLSFGYTMAWDRYTNETEQTISSYSFQSIIHYSFTVSTAQTVILETKDSNGDTYMYLWSDVENRQIAKDDDGGISVHSKITSFLQPGNYKVFVRSYSSNYSSTCDLYKNGYRVLNDKKFAGTQIYVGSHDAETRFRTTNISGDTYVLLLNSSGNLIGYDDDGGDGYASSVIAAEKPSKFIVGAYSSYSEGSATVKYTKDDHLEFRTYCGGPNSKFPKTGNKFINDFDSGDYYHQYVLQAYRWQFLDNSLHDEQGADSVDLVLYAGHGDSGTISDFNYNHSSSEAGGNWDTSSIHIASQEGRAGSGHRSSNKSGDLEYIGFLSCEVVKTVDIDWQDLEDNGWISHYDNGNLVKGFFDGVHVVVGYDTEHRNYHWSNNARVSIIYQAHYFANYLDSGYSIWNAWKKAHYRATNKLYDSWFMDKINIGTASTLAIASQADETLSDFKSEDITINNGNYAFTWYNYVYKYD